MGESKLTDPERPRLGDEVYRHPLIPQMIAMDPSDQLPRPVSQVSLEDTKAPALDPDTMVCMGDESVFVIRDQWGKIAADFPPTLVRTKIAGGSVSGYLVLVGNLTEIQAANLVRAGLCDRSGHHLVNEYGSIIDDLWVEPLRTQCHHYKRVMTDFQGAVDGDNKTAKQVERVCAAQRGESGEYVSLNNTRVYACEHRSPRDFVSEERLRRFDADQMAAASKTTEQWDLAAAEAAWEKGETKDG